MYNTGTYFLMSADGRKVKIGRSQHLEKRIRNLRYANGTQLHWLGTVAYEEEATLHERFAAMRSHGEWFYLRGDLLDFIADSFGGEAIETIERVRTEWWTVRPRTSPARLWTDRLARAQDYWFQCENGTQWKHYKAVDLLGVEVPDKCEYPLEKGEYCDCDHCECYRVLGQWSIDWYPNLEGVGFTAAKQRIVFLVRRLDGELRTMLRESADSLDRFAAFTMLVFVGQPDKVYNPMADALYEMNAEANGCDNDYGDAIQYGAFTPSERRAYYRDICGVDVDAQPVTQVIVGQQLALFAEDEEC